MALSKGEWKKKIHVANLKIEIKTLSLLFILYMHHNNIDAKRRSILSSSAHVLHIFGRRHAFLVDLNFTFWYQTRLLECVRVFFYFSIYSSSIKEATQSRVKPSIS